MEVGGVDVFISLSHSVGWGREGMRGVRGRWERWSLSGALRQLAEGCAERVSDKQKEQVQGEEAALPPGDSQGCF